MTYAAVSALCALFYAVYRSLSFGEDSLFMRWMFVPPLALGALPALFCLLLGRRPVRWAFYLWNSGVALLACGCLFRGIVEMSGRFTQYDRVYWVLGGAALGAALLRAVFAAHRQPQKRRGV